MQRNRIYIDIEVLRCPPEDLQPWMPGYPHPLPAKRAWLDKQRRVLECAVPRAEDIRAPKNYKDDAKIAAFIQGKIDEAKQRCAPAALEAAYAELETDREAKLAELSERSSLEPILDGQIYCVGVAVGDAEPVVLTADSECDLLALLERGLRHHESQGRQTIVAFNGFGYDFGMLARKAMKHRNGWVAKRFHFERSWQAHGLADPLQLWRMGERWTKGGLRAISGFLGGFQVPEWYDGINHGALDFLVAEQPGTVEEMCKVDVGMLRHIDQAMLQMGWSYEG